MPERASEPVLLIDKSEGITTLTLNRPRSMNALSIELRNALAKAFTDLQDDPGTRVVITTGAGDRAFCAGLDLKELGGESAPKTGASSPDEAIGSGTDIVKAMEAFDRPIIGAINGVAITGGFELALACDVMIGSTNARFADTHARVGIMPGWGLSQRLPRLIGTYRAKALSLTGNFISAQEALDYGLLFRVVDPPDLLEECRSMARDMISCKPEMVLAYKRVIDRGFAETFADGLRIEIEANRARSREITPDMIAQARLEVTARGRKQVS
jgi:enoyl-CoA hydratase